MLSVSKDAFEKSVLWCNLTLDNFTSRTCVFCLSWVFFCYRPWGEINIEYRYDYIASIRSGSCYCFRSQPRIDVNKTPPECNREGLTGGSLINSWKLMNWFRCGRRRKKTSSCRGVRTSLAAGDALVASRQTWRTTVLTGPATQTPIRSNVQKVRNSDCDRLDCTRSPKLRFIYPPW